MQAKQWDAALDWELKQSERAQMRFRAAEYEKRMTRQAARQRRKDNDGGVAATASSLQDAFAAGVQQPKRSSGVAADQSEQVVADAGGEFDWGFGSGNDAAIATLDLANAPPGMQLATMLQHKGCAAQQTRGGGAAVSKLDIDAEQPLVTMMDASSARASAQHTVERNAAGQDASGRSHTQTIADIGLLEEQAPHRRVDRPGAELEGAKRCSRSSAGSSAAGSRQAAPGSAAGGGQARAASGRGSLDTSVEALGAKLQQMLGSHDANVRS